MNARADQAIGAALAAAYVAVLLYTAPAIGLSRDEGMYVLAAESYARWFELLAHDPGSALEQANIDRYFRVNHEHPALVKSLFALSHLLDRELGLFTRESLAHRFPGMVSAGLLLWLIYVFGVRSFGRRVGLFAALAYALLPRPFYHSHLNAFDVPITLALTALTYGYWRSLLARRWALATGALFGLALATKHNSWILPGVFAIHFALVVVLERVRRKRAGSRAQALAGGSSSAAAASAASAASAPAQVRLRPDWLFAMTALGPPIFVASWPWLWNDALARLRGYAAFHLHHDYYNIAYFGVNHFWPPFPVSYPWVMTLYTVPVTTLLLAVVGLTVRTRAVLADARAALRGEPAADPRLTSVLWLGALLAPLVVISLPSTPIFGGTKHWFPAYPFLALFAGVGFERALSVYAGWLSSERFTRVRAQLHWPLGALLLLPAWVETAHSHPFGLSHYGFAAGFVPGAADRGMNRQFWGFTTRSLSDFFARQLPRGGRVWICDTLDASFRMLVRDGHLPSGIVPAADIASADYAIVHHEHHFAEVDHQIWTAYGTTRPVYVLTYDGVPIISVYENPR
jgi:4-amino-4-deoxy-L-arabinose transferase-like glycosyltransferase